MWRQALTLHSLDLVRRSSTCTFFHTLLLLPLLLSSTIFNNTTFSGTHTQTHMSENSHPSTRRGWRGRPNLFLTRSNSQARTVHQTSLLDIESNLDRLGLLSPTHDQRSQQQSGQITLQPVLINNSRHFFSLTGVSP